jgi:hypothetical protein
MDESEPFREMKPAADRTARDWGTGLAWQCKAGLKQMKIASLITIVTHR